MIKRVNLQFNTNYPEKEKAALFLDKIEGRKKSSFVAYLIVKYLDKNNIKAVEDIERLTPEKVEELYAALISESSDSNVSLENENILLLNIINSLVNQSAPIETKKQVDVIEEKLAKIKPNKDFSKTNITDEGPKEDSKCEADFELDMDDISAALSSF